jgi:hypothetical protein
MVRKKFRTIAGFREAVDERLFLFGARHIAQALVLPPQDGPLRFYE